MYTSQRLTLRAGEVRSTKWVAPGRRRPEAYGRSIEGNEVPEDAEGHMLAQSKRE
jgi:hypothetical protein